MFITNQLTPVEMLSELLHLPGRDKAETACFRKLGHDKHLCPAFRDRVEAMLAAYKAHRTDVQDVQGSAISQPELMEIYDEWLESSAAGGSGDGVGELIWSLDGGGFCYSVEGGDDRLAIGDFSTAWCALYFDQLQRYGGDVRRRLSLLLGIAPPAF